MTRHAMTVFVDALFLLLLVLVLLPHEPDQAEADSTRVGSLVVEIRWPDDYHSDVDLWVQSPGDFPVGYARLRGTHFSLLRDDLGTGGAPSRFEIAVSREIPDGHYTANIHLFSDREQNAPFPVRARVWYRDDSGHRHEIWQGNVTAQWNDREKTLVRWRMQDGRLEHGSIHHSPVSLIARLR